MAFERLDCCADIGEYFARASGLVREQEIGNAFQIGQRRLGID
jgi:hypothetical protein